MGTVCARFHGYPSDYMKKHDWSDLSSDYLIARQCNAEDQKKHNEELEALYGKK